MNKTYILILNWNAWQDTVECLESVFHNAYSDYKVIVCDNGSKDGSIEHIKAWASSKLIPYIEYNQVQAETGGDSAQEAFRLIIIRSDHNLGFAGGNNIGLRYILRQDDVSYVWLLNNDTVIHPDSLRHLVQRMLEKKDAGICGSTLIYYHDAKRIQAFGGAVYNKWLGVSRHIGGFAPVGERIDSIRVEEKMDYVVGASMLITKQFLQHVGLLSEDYFLYFEELDWAIRARQSGYTLAFAPQSIVYHKEGASIGSSSKPGEKSVTADYYGLKNKLVFTRNFFPKALPTIYVGLLISMGIRIYRRQWERVWMIMKIIMGH